jgi:hypothetical protein
MLFEARSAPWRGWGALCLPKTGHYNVLEAETRGFRAANRPNSFVTTRS